MLFATEHWNWDTWTGENPEDYDDEEHAGAYDESGPHCEDENFIVSQLFCKLCFSKAIFSARHVFVFFNKQNELTKFHSIQTDGR